MRRSIVLVAVSLALLAAGPAEAASVKPRTLDVKVGPFTTDLSVLRRGSEVYASWSEGTVGDNDKAVVFDAATGRLVREIKRDGATAVEVLGDGWTQRRRQTQDTLLVLTEKIKDTKDPNDPLRVRDVADGKLIAELTANEKPLAVLRQKDGVLLLSGGQNIVPGADKLSYALRMFMQGTDKPRWSVDIPAATPAPPDNPFVNVATTLSPDGRWVTAVRDKVLYLIDAETGRLRSVDIERGEGPIGVGFSADSSKLYVAGGNYQIAEHRSADLSLLRRIAVPDRYTVRHIVERESGRVLELDGRRQTMFLDTATSQFVRHDRGGSVSSYTLAWLGNGNVLRASKTRRSPITYGVYRHENGKFRQLYRREWKGGSMDALTWSPNGRCILMSGGGKTMIMGPLTGGEVVPLEVKGDGLGAAVFARDGRVVVTPDGAGKLLSYAMPGQCHSKVE